MTQHTINLPYQTPPLTANQKTHWATHAQHTKNLRQTTHILAKHHKIPRTTHTTVTLHYVPRTNRRRDQDNLVPTLKPICDGLVDAGIVPDDTPEFMTKHMPVIDPKDPGQRASRLYVVVEVD